MPDYIAAHYVKTSYLITITSMECCVHKHMNMPYLYWTDRAWRIWQVRWIRGLPKGGKQTQN